MRLVNQGGTCQFCGHDVTGREPQDACPANQDGDTMHSTVRQVRDIADAEIIQLRSDAARAGNSALRLACSQALAGDQTARVKVAAVITDAEAAAARAERADAAWQPDRRDLEDWS